ncbi:MAG: efflux RND transporter periplasmic adaptor subunit [Opitutales bacterium]|nr:efflux RND transporter periplasmic adaptor subunit [Opitutales bacterium]
MNNKDNPPGNDGQSRQPEPHPSASAGRAPASATPHSPQAAGPRTATLVVVLVSAFIFLVLGILLADPVKGLWGWMTDRVTAEDGPDADDGQWYISGMHPWIIRPEPGHCPVCGMELTPLSPDMLTGDLSIDPQIVQNIGVRLAEVTRGPFRTTLHTVGTVEADERTRREIVLRAPGYIETAHIRYVGQPVKRGAPLAEIHSPDILSALSELRAFARSNPDGAEARATRERLRVLGLTREQVAEIEASGEVPWTVTLKSPVDGVVMNLDAFEGQWVPEGGRLAEIADLTRVWVLATVFESHLERVREGMRGVARIAHRPADRLEGEVAYLYPTLDPRTRQGRVRLEFANEDGRLKPGMFVRLELDDSGEDDVLQVPREAVLDTGTRQIAYVSRGGGRFEPREVRAGRESEAGMLEIFEGLAAGEPVVVSGQFLLDSESRLRESLLKLVMGETAAEQRVEAPVDAEPALGEMPADLAQALGEMLDGYLAAAAPLVDDHIDGVRDAARKMRDAARQLGDLDGLPDDVASVLGAEAGRIAASAEGLAEAGSPRRARIALRDLSDALRAVVRATGLPPDYAQEIHEVRCPMFPEMGENAWWFQTDTTVANPYMGQSMLTCHDARFALPRAGERLGDRDEPDDPAPEADEEDREVARGEVTDFPEMSLPEEGRSALARALRAYLAIGTTLVGDSIGGVAAEAETLRDGLRDVTDAGTEEDAHAFHKDDVLERSRRAAAFLIETDSLEDARMAFAILGEELVGLLEAAGVPPEIEADLIAARCHMYPEFGDNGWWIQKDGDLENPLWGPAMLRCADLTRPLARADNGGRPGQDNNGHGGHSHD